MLNLHVYTPTQEPVAIESLRPTQIAIGLLAVQTKAAELRKIAKKDGDRLIRKHIVPVVRGPKRRLYVIDHHHLCRAILTAGADKVYTTVVLDLHALSRDEFWPFMDAAGLCHPFDEDGKRKTYADIPKRIADMPDDPFRSLAGELRRRGYYAKDVAPFSEFMWADFLRRRITRKQVEESFGAMLEHAADLAKSPEAGHLPGWCGPTA